MAENNEINLDSLLVAKKAEIKTALDFGDRFMSSILIDIPAANRKEYIQANRRC